MKSVKVSYWGAPHAGSDRRFQHPWGWRCPGKQVILGSLSTGSQAGDVPKAHCSMYSQAQIILLTIRRASLTPRDQESWKDNPGKRGGAFISSSDGSTIDYGLRCSYLASSDADDVRLGKVPALSLRLVWQIRCICAHVSNIWHVALHCTSLPPGRAKGTSETFKIIFNVNTTQYQDCQNSNHKKNVKTKQI